MADQARGTMDEINSAGSEDDELGEDNSIKSFVVDFGKGDEKGSLQDAFKRYRRTRQKEIKKIRRVKHRPGELGLRARADPESMWQLRIKFLNQCKKYFGVPYAKKYWTKEDPEYYSPFFLDCCGLVRRCLRDMRRDFGFRIGPWNQAYMYDTLPLTVTKEEDMKPGDLVFISATYYNPKSKKQRHNMTHVEVWLGEGPKTIGARWQKGKVQVFDHYKFKASSYHSETYIFKSIDTWLMGICRSHCPQHPWRTRAERFVPSNKSVFSVANQQEQNQKDQSAGDTDEDLLRDQVKVSQDGTDIPKDNSRSLQTQHTPRSPKVKGQHKKRNASKSASSSQTMTSEDQQTSPTRSAKKSGRKKKSSGKRKIKPARKNGDQQVSVQQEQAQSPRDQLQSSIEKQSCDREKLPSSIETQSSTMEKLPSALEKLTIQGSSCGAGAKDSETKSLKQGTIVTSSGFIYPGDSPVFQSKHSILCKIEPVPAILSHDTSSRPPQQSIRKGKELKKQACFFPDIHGKKTLHGEDGEVSMKIDAESSKSEDHIQSTGSVSPAESPRIFLSPDTVEERTGLDNRNSWTKEEKDCFMGGEGLGKSAYRDQSPESWPPHRKASPSSI